MNKTAGWITWERKSFINVLIKEGRTDELVFGEHICNNQVWWKEHETALKYLITDGGAGALAELYVLVLQTGLRSHDWNLHILLLPNLQQEKSWNS